MNKSFFYLFIAAVSLTVIACQSNTPSNDPSQESMSHEEVIPSEAYPDSVEGSPRISSMANVGNAHIHIDYSTPAVRGRIIWGGLVPYGTVWVTGAHDATSMNFPVDVEVAGQRIPAGTYAFFTIPGETEWTLILNRNWQQHLTRDYNEAEDVVRWTVTPEATEFTNRLTYNVIPTGDNTGRITMRWENLMIGFDVKVSQ